MSSNNVNHEVDFMDINWVIDHVSTIRQRIDVLKKLGYQIGYNVFLNDERNKIKSVTVGKQGELRIQVSEKIEGLPLVFCVIINDNKDNGK